MSILRKVSSIVVPMGWDIFHEQRAAFGYRFGYEGEVMLPLEVVK